MYYALFYRSQLVPRWLSGWGIDGVLLMLCACLMALFSDNPITGYTLLVLPIAVQELVLAVWLLVKGFFWRLREKYVIRDFHPLVFFYVLGFLSTLADAVHRP